MSDVGVGLALLGVFVVVGLGYVAYEIELLRQELCEWRRELRDWRHELPNSGTRSIDE
jgi:hypothetical protein